MRPRPSAGVLRPPHPMGGHPSPPPSPPRLAVFQSHPNQHFTPWWREVHAGGAVEIHVFYYSAANASETFDPHFGTSYRFDGGLLEGYPSSILLPGPFHRPREVPRPLWINRGLTEVFEEGPPSAVLLFGYNLVNNWIVQAEAGRRGIPVLYFSDSNVRILPPFSNPREAAKRVLIRRFFAEVAAFLSPGNANREFLHVHGVEDERIWRCPYPIDVARFTREASAARERRIELRRELGLSPDDFVAAFLGKFIPRKRPLDLVSAVRKIEDGSVKALMIGTGPLEKEIRDRGGDRVRVTGFVNQSEIPRVLATADVFVMPSDADAHPLAVTEALASGLPVLVSETTGCHGPDDAVREGRNGLVFRCGDPGDLAARLAVLARDPERVRALSANALELSETQSAQEAARQLTRCLLSLGEVRTSSGRGWQDEGRNEDPLCRRVAPKGLQLDEPRTPSRVEGARA